MSEPRNTHTGNESVSPDHEAAAAQGKIKRAIDINLPRPRSSEQLSTAEFGKYVGEIWNELRIEATRGMIDAEKAIAAR